MRTFRKLLTILLAVLLFSSFSVAFAATDAYYIQSKNYISVSGTASAGSDISIMLKKSGEAMSDDSILYIGQTKADKNGNYALDFTVSSNPFVIADAKVTNYEIIVNADGEVTSNNVSASATLSEITEIDLDMSTKGKAKAIFEESAKYQNLDYAVIVAFYDAGGKLLKITDSVGYLGDDGVFNYGKENIPQSAKTVKGFLWENKNSLIPVVGAQNAVFTDKSYDRKAEFLTMAPGGDESKRNFAWYDIPGVKNVRIQYAEKVTGTANDFGDDNIFEGTCGSTEEIKKWNGTKPGSGTQYFSYGHNYTWAKASISGLEKGKTYVYRLGDDEGWLSGIYEFSTDVAPEDGFSVLLFSDEHIRPSMKQVLKTLDDVRDKAFSLRPNASLVIATGDQLDYPWEEMAYKRYYERTKMESVPLATVPGTTHDMLFENTRTDFEVSLYGFHTNMPNAHITSGKLNNVGANYWYTYGDVLFMGINYNGWSSSDPTVQKAFIEEAIAQAEQEAESCGSSIKWKVLYSHYPFGFASSEDKIDKYYGEDDDFIADNGIDVVFHGHEHAYWRTYQVYSGENVDKQATSSDNLNWSITNPEKSAVHFSLNTSGLLGGVVSDDSKYEKLKPFIAYTDADAKYGLMNDYRGKEYTSHFTVLDIETTDDACTLTVNTYRNTHSGAAQDSANTEKDTVALSNTTLIDSYKIIKTN